MQNSPAKIAQIIDKLLAKTAAGEQIWTSSLMSGRYQARFGDFAIEISSSSVNSFLGGGATSMTITRLDGAKVAQAGGANLPVAATSMSARTALNAETQAKLDHLFQMVSDNGKDLDELLKLM